MTSQTGINLPLKPNAQTTLHLSNSAHTNVSDIVNLVNQIEKGSKSGETLQKTQKSFASNEGTIENSFETFRKLLALTSHLGYQLDAIEKSVKQTSIVTEQIKLIKFSE